MFAPLLALFLAQTPDMGCGFSCVQSTSTIPGQAASVELRLSLTLEPTKVATIDLNQVDEQVAGIYRMDIHDLEVNSPSYRDTKVTYLVLDDFNILKQQPIKVAFLDQVELDLPLTVIALEWPQGMTKDQVLALYEIDLGRRSVTLAGLK